MKKKMLSMFVLLGAVLVGAACKAQAQFAEVVNASIPFQFHAGAAEYPAGHYSIRFMSTSDGNVIEIQSADGRTAGLFQTLPADISDLVKNNELVFHHVGGNYFLSEIVDVDDSIGAEVSNPNSSVKQVAAQGATGHNRIRALFHVH